MDRNENIQLQILAQIQGLLILINHSYQFDVSFSKDAIIYFGVYLYDGESSATIIY